MIHKNTVLLAIATLGIITGLHGMEAAALSKERIVEAYNADKLKSYIHDLDFVDRIRFAKSIKDEVFSLTEALLNDPNNATVDQVTTALALNAFLVETDVAQVTAYDNTLKLQKLKETLTGPSPEEVAKREKKAQEQKEELARKHARYEEIKKELIAIYKRVHFGAAQVLRRQKDSVIKPTEQKEFASYIKDEVFEKATDVQHNPDNYTYDQIRDILALVIIIRLEGEDDDQVKALDHEIILDKLAGEASSKK